MGIRYKWLLFAMVVALAVAVWRRRSSRDGFIATETTTKQLLIDNYGPEIVWDDLYTDAHAIQTRYLNTLSKANPEVDARAELERVAGVTPLRCSPQEVGTLLTSAASPSQGQAYLNCIPSSQDFQRLTEFLVNELKTSLANGINALSGNIGIPTTEAFATIVDCCKSQNEASMRALTARVPPHKITSSSRSYLRGLLDEGLRAIKEIDSINTSAQEGTLPFTPPTILN